MNYFYILSGMIIFTLLMSSPTSLAWKNGNKAVSGNTSLHGAYISEYKKDYSDPIAANTLRKYYGTHDWIAESALELLYLVHSHLFLTKLWDINNPDDLRIWFLVGTELPDAWTISPNFKTRCERSFTKQEFPREGHSRLYFWENELSIRMPRDDAAARVADALYSSIRNAFQEKDCQAAAVFIGALMHVIADATFYGHLIEGLSSHSVIQTHVNHVTYKTWADGDRFLVVGATEFFNINEARGKLTGTVRYSPYLATIYAGMGTYYGDDTFKDSNWLLQNAPSSTNHAFWEDVDGYWTGYSQEDAWTHSKRPSSGDASIYFDTLEHNLNMAIYYCAAALNYVITYGGYTDCGCSGEYPPGQQPDPSQKEGVQDKEGLKIALDEFQALFFLGAVGLASTMISLTLVSKMLGIIEKMIPVW